ncbi:MAG: DUF1996 domain-containing protein [Paraglaciecola sp.]|nr:DUF1996 domain-containing protein [Paraglaciecola sp.]
MYIKTIAPLTIILSLSTVLTACGGGQSSTDPVTSASTTQQNQTESLDLIVQTKPEALTTQAYAIFEFNASLATQYLCVVDGATVDHCQSPLTVMPLAVGEHLISVVASNDVGQQSEAFTYSWTVQSLFSQPLGQDTPADLIKTTVQPAAVAPNSWRGIFRINCDFAHASYNDPIVFPGQENAAHLHRFYGNTLADHQSTSTSLFTEGESSCQGNKLNLSAYWIPALLAPVYNLQTGEAVYDEQGEPQWQMVPAVVGNDEDAHEIFYYSAGIDDVNAIQPVPVGLRMIAGDHMGQPGMQQDTSIVRWHCQSWGSDDATNPRFSASIPECVAPDRLRMDIFFPSCWNGSDLDSADHKSHMAYPINEGQGQGTHCPSSHPVALVRPSYHYAFGVKPEVYEPQTQSSRGWKLAADSYHPNNVVPGGLSLHADWFNAWHPEVMQAILDNCIKNRLDCHDGNLANGYRLSATRAGTQFEPTVINAGAGPG